ncbi:META domain-containing protein [Algoriphagus litoralis]|uniref:META domain-containing protein n=1 Tax=Algoriphagus litoralis TaxID=2202829 RepID=UPI000DB9247D|nr:META domain-containing protein [Algoriphagus litoralis]
MKLHRIAVLGLLVLILGGCSSSAGLNPLSLLTGKSWALSSLMGGEIDPSKFTAGVPTLDFLEGGRLAGFAGCNNFSGGFSLEGTDIKLDPGAMTRKACPGGGEEEFISALNRVKNFTVAKEKLTLLDGATELMSFVPKKD